MNNLAEHIEPIFYKESQKINNDVGFRYNCFIKSDDKLILHRHDYYEICFLPYDSCDHLANNVLTNFPKGSLIFIRPDDCHDFVNYYNKNIVIMHFAVRRHIIESLFEFLGEYFPSQELISAPFPPYVILDSYEITELIALFSQLNSIDFSDNKRKSIVMRSTLSKIFAQYFTRNETASPDKKLSPEWLLRTYNEMKNIENFSQGIDRMVEISGHTKEHLCRCFKKYYGITAMDSINDLRLTYIANMLIYTDVSIINLCYDSGYTNLSWMYSLFRKKYGVSPLKFRKTNA